MLDHRRCVQQLALICALSSGATMINAAGVHDNTIINWRRNLLPIQHALAHQQWGFAAPDAPTSVRLKTAIAVTQPQPEPVNAAPVHNDAQPSTQPFPANP